MCGGGDGHQGRRRAGPQGEGAASPLWRVHCSGAFRRWRREEVTARGVGRAGGRVSWEKWRLRAAERSSPAARLGPPGTGPSAMPLRGWRCRRRSRVRNPGQLNPLSFASPAQLCPPPRLCLLEPAPAPWPLLLRPSPSPRVVLTVHESPFLPRPLWPPRPAPGRTQLGGGRSRPGACVCTCFSIPVFCFSLLSAC